MIERFKNSIISPGRIVDYRGDSLFKVLLYILFFAVLLSTRTIINTVIFDGLSSGTKREIRDEFNEVDSSCLISSGILECGSEENVLLVEDYIVSYYINSTSDVKDSKYNDGYNVVFNGDSVYFILGSVELYNIKISDLPAEIQNIDFQLQTSNPDQFYSDVFKAVDATLLSVKNVWAPMIIVFDVLASFVMFMLFILLSSWLMKLRFKPVKFKQLFTMTVYSSTALYVILIMNSLYSLNMFIVIILVIVAFRQNNQLSFELYKRLNKKP